MDARPAGLPSVFLRRRARAWRRRRLTLIARLSRGSARSVMQGGAVDVRAQAQAGARRSAPATPDAPGRCSQSLVTPTRRQPDLAGARLRGAGPARRRGPAEALDRRSGSTRTTSARCCSRPTISRPPATRRGPPPLPVGAEVGRSGRAVTPDLEPELRRAQQDGGLCGALRGPSARAPGGARFTETSATRRFAQSLDLLVGRKQVYQQQPRFYIFPSCRRSSSTSAPLPLAGGDRGPDGRDPRRAAGGAEGRGRLHPLRGAAAFREGKDPYGLLGNPD